MTFQQPKASLGKILDCSVSLKEILCLAIAEHPDVGGDAGIVEHIEGQSDDGLQPVVFDSPAADVALALPGVTGEQGTTFTEI